MPPRTIGDGGGRAIPPRGRDHEAGRAPWRRQCGLRQHGADGYGRDRAVYRHSGTCCVPARCSFFPFSTWPSTARTLHVGNRGTATIARRAFVKVCGYLADRVPTAKDPRQPVRSSTSTALQCRVATGVRSHWCWTARRVPSRGRHRWLARPGRLPPVLIVRLRRALSARSSRPRH
jgi:hypothetical protein